MRFTEGQEKQLVLWENINCADYNRKTGEEEKEQTDYTVKDISARYTLLL